jgi:hypothetical protein
MNLARFFIREPKSYKGIRERSTIIPSAELSMPPFREPVTRDQARAAMARSLARRRANGEL